MANRITFCFAVVLAAVYLYAAGRFPALHLSDPLGPQAFPRLLGIGLLLSAAGLLAETLRAGKPGSPSPWMTSSRIPCGSG